MHARSRSRSGAARPSASCTRRCGCLRGCWARSAWRHWATGCARSGAFDKTRCIRQPPGQASLQREQPEVPLCRGLQGWPRHPMPFCLDRIKQTRVDASILELEPLSAFCAGIGGLPDGAFPQGRPIRRDHAHAPMDAQAPERPEGLGGSDRKPNPRPIRARGGLARWGRSVDCRGLSLLDWPWLVRAIPRRA